LTAYLVFVVNYRILDPLDHCSQDLGLIRGEFGGGQIEESPLEDDLNIMVLQDRAGRNAWWINLLLEFTIELDK
jgi:hypothetical protein